MRPRSYSPSHVDAEAYRATREADSRAVSGQCERDRRPGRALLTRSQGTAAASRRRTAGPATIAAIARTVTGTAATAACARARLAAAARAAHHQPGGRLLVGVEHRERVAQVGAILLALLLHALLHRRHRLRVRRAATAGVARRAAARAHGRVHR